ncbi:MAG: hypothetical protein QM775_10495 [Pirellulales bacterium]
MVVRVETPYRIRGQDISTKGEIHKLCVAAAEYKLTTVDLKSKLFAYPTMTAEYCRLL